MLHRQERFHRQVLQIIDAGLLSGALVLAHSFRYWLAPHLLWFEFQPVGPLVNYFFLVLLIFFVGPFFLVSQGFYRLTVKRQWWTSVLRAGQAVVLIWLLLLSVIVLVRIPQEEMSRAALVIFLPTAVTFLTLRDQGYQLWLRRSGSLAHSRRHVLICGVSVCHAGWQELLESSPQKDFLVKACLDLRANTLNEFIALIHQQNIDIVIFEFDEAMLLQQNQAILACEAEGIEAWVTADYIHTVLARPSFDELLGRRLLVYRTTPDISWQLLAKSFVDIGGAAVLLILLSPLFLLISLLVWVTSRSPVIFSQRRSGRYGRPFTLFKFRTMISNAEQRQLELQIFNQMSGPVFKMENDPRITPLGHWLRRYSLDELPQLWNVLCGEMSLVGPRPLPLSETEGLIDFSQRRRMSVKPGLTCLWQIAGRSEITDFGDWVRLDLDYIDHWSIWLDLSILLRTIPVVLSGRGAK